MTVYSRIIYDKKCEAFKIDYDDVNRIYSILKRFHTLSNTTNILGFYYSALPHIFTHSIPLTLFHSGHLQLNLIVKLQITTTFRMRRQCFPHIFLSPKFFNALYNQNRTVVFILFLEFIISSQKFLSGYPPLLIFFFKTLFIVTCLMTCIYFVNTEMVLW